MTREHDPEARPPPSCAAFVPATLAQEIDALHRSAAERAGVDLAVLLGRGAEIARLGDGAAVAQVLHALVESAILSAGGGTVEVTLEAPSGRPLRLRLRHDGHAGPQGASLAPAQRLVSAMQGEFAADHRPDGGTLLTVTLPLPQADTGGRRPAGPGLADGSPAGGFDGLRILLAEDNPTNQIILRAMLERLGCRPVITEDGVAALEQWEPGRFDLVLLDIAMPRMDGMQTLAALRDAERRAAAARVPVIAVTANAMAEQVAEYAARGFDGHVTKPVSLDALAAALAGACPPGHGISPSG